jgi:hypothetical protein
MKLRPEERSILAFFPSGPKAQTALDELKQAGYTEVQMDHIGRFGFDPEVDLDRVGRDATSLAASTLAPEQNLDDDTRVLLAAMPAASGMAGHIDEDGAAFLVTVVTDEDQVDQAVRIVQQLGGRV